MRLRTICLHGPESTGKSTLAPRLAAHLGGQWVPEYGRAYTEEHGTGWTMADLVAIAEGHDAVTRAALAAGPLPVVLDTDPLMTEAWAEMLHERRWPRDDPRGESYQRDRTRWRVGLNPRAALFDARTRLAGCGREFSTALDLLTRWPAG